MHCSGQVTDNLLLTRSCQLYSQLRELSSHSVPHKKFNSIGKNKMYVCKAFYQQFEWALKSHWAAVSEYPVLVCTGDDDKVTPIKGAEDLYKLLLLQSTGKETTAEGINNDVAITGNMKEQNSSSSTKSASIKSTDSTGRLRLSVISNAGHHVLEEQPEQLASLMDSFFSEACGLFLSGNAAAMK